MKGAARATDHLAQPEPRNAESSALNARELALLGGALSVSVIGVAFNFLSGAVDAVGKDTPLTDPAVDYAWGMGTAALLGAVIFAVPLALRERIALVTLWCVKILVTLVAMLPYERHYADQLDAFSYFLIPRQGFDPPGFALGDGTENMYNLVSIMYRVMPESYHALKTVFSFVGLVGSFLFYRAIAAARGHADLRVLYLLALFPSILFWSSILGKDPLVFFAIALYAYGAVRWLGGAGLRAIAPIAVGITLATFVRPWLAPILVIPLLVTSIIYGRAVTGLLTLMAFGAVALVMGAGALREKFGIDTVQDALQAANTVATAWAHGGSGLELGADLTQPRALVAALPLAAFTALFRPLPFEIPNVFGLLAGIENVVLMVMLLFALVRFRLSDLSSPPVVWAVLLVLVWTAFYAFLSYQNLGTAVRFRLQILPVLLALLAFFGRLRKSRLTTSPHGPTLLAPNGR